VRQAEPPTQIVLSWSGGKDSSLALAALRADPAYKVVGLLTSVTREYDRISIHGVRRSLLEAQAASLALPLFEVTLDRVSSNDAYEAAFRAAVARMREHIPGLRHIAYGDLFLEDVRAYRERLSATADVVPIFPIWGRPTGELARQFVDAGYRAHLVCVDTQQLAADFAGRTFDNDLLGAFPSSIDPCGERGEFHTFVSNGPIFREAVDVRVGEIVLRDERFAYADLLPANLSENGALGG
jgi:uncharacterized protein (TIGR00290 family)